MAVKMWLVLLLRGIVSLIYSQSSEFAPDEFWQTTEVATTLHFGHGHLTWEWREGLRSYVVPLIITGVYKIGAFVGLDQEPLFLTMAPQLLQLALTTYALTCFFEFARERVGAQGAHIGYLLLLMNWFAIYCGARLIVNQTELSLNLIGLWLLTRKYWIRFVIIVTLNFIIRPTAAIFWIPFIPEVLGALIFNGEPGWRKYIKVIGMSAVGVLILLLGGLLDFAMSKKLSWWEFLKFNLVQSGNAEFGVHPMMWYLYSASPSILGPASFFIFVGIMIPGQTRLLTMYIMFYEGVYSALDHKEIRFLVPVFPLLFCVLGSIVDRIFTVSNLRCIFRRWILVGFFAINLIAGVLIGFSHQCGVRPATRFIHEGMKGMENPNVWVLTPCYSVPIYTYLPHPNANYEFYICAPERFRDQYAINNQLIQPNGFQTVDLRADIKNKLETSISPPDFVLIFDYSFEPFIQAMRPEGYIYLPCAQFRHTFVSDAARYVYVFCKNRRPKPKFEEPKPNPIQMNQINSTDPNFIVQ